MNLYQKICHEIENHREFWNYYGGKLGDIWEKESCVRKFIVIILNTIRSYMHR